MNPTLALPTAGKVAPTDEQVTRARAYLLAHVGSSYQARHSFAEGYLASVVRSLADRIPNALVSVTLTQALAVIVAVEQLDTEADGFTTTGRDNPSTAQDLPAGVDGYSLGRYAR